MVIKRTLIEDSEGKYDKERFDYHSDRVGDVVIRVCEAQTVEAGDVLYTITRLGVTKTKTAQRHGVLAAVNSGADQQFVGYDTPMVTLEHVLSEEEKRILEEERYYDFILADIGAKYFVTLYKGAQPLVAESSIINPGDIIVLSMVQKKKREIEYEGPAAELKRIYFSNGQELRKGDRLFGVVVLPAEGSG